MNARGKNLPEKATTDSQGGAKLFISAIEPFFYGRALTYVDVGAHHGAVVSELLQSSLRIREAHLIEPNPKAFARLVQTTGVLAADSRLHCHNVALSASEGRLRLRDQGTMTHVVSSAESADSEQVFEVESRTLDNLVESAGIEHVHLLKIDIEGHEAEMLRGAHHCLSSEIVDVIYIEAGFNPESRQQTYYRAIEDVLNRYGYKIFNIFEPKNEWIEDNPLLRRVNLAFMSARFAAGNPYRVSQELFNLRVKYKELEDEKNRVLKSLEEKDAMIEKLNEELSKKNLAASAAYEQDLATRGAALAESHAQLSDLQGHLAEAKESTRTLQEQRARLEKDRDALLKHSRELEKRYKAVLASTTWRAMGPARLIMRNVKATVTGRPATPNRIPRMPKLATQGREEAPKRVSAKSPQRSGAAQQPRLRERFAASVQGGLRETYARLPDNLKAAVPSAAKDLVRSKTKGLSAISPLVKKYDDKLWGGFSRQALIDLRKIKEDKSLPARDRAEACYSLARWNAVQGDFAAALREIEDRRKIDPRRTGSKQYMPEAQFLCRLGRAKDARALLERSIAGKPFNTSTELMLANTWNPVVTGERTAEGEARVLEQINKIYRHFGLAEIEKRDPAAELSIDNLRGKDIKDRFDPDNKVTVIVPAYNAADTIDTALIGLAEQSWRNLEVLVVDDCSTDETAAVVEAFCVKDDRFKLIRQATNGGSYACRNRALDEASGHYVTIHDGDDWSHPQKIETLVEAQLRDPAPYKMSMWVRTYPEMTFYGGIFQFVNLLSPDLSSALFRREVFEKCGKWDLSRVSADTEMIWRVERIFEGDRSKSMSRRVLAQCPLAFGRLLQTSLTQTGATDMRTMFHGVRREYREAAEFWHKNLVPEKAAEFFSQAVPPYFPAPSIIRSGPSQSKNHVSLIVADWNLKGGAVNSAANMAKASTLVGDTAILHYRSYNRDVVAPLDENIRRFASDNNIRIVSPGEEISAKNVIISYPPIMEYALDRLPKVDFESLFVVVNQMAERDVRGDDIAYRPEVVRKNLQEFFGQEGQWAPISNRVRKLMEDDPRYPAPHRDTWTPMIDAEAWTANQARWRGKKRTRPVIGRHGRDHPLKWPGTREALFAAYCVGKDCEMRFLGGAQSAYRLAGRRPANWQEEAYGARDVKEFLSDLDFFIHYPHEDYIEEFGRAPMEAMAVGVPVILPPVFKDTFGEAALYAEPNEVWSLIQSLWCDEAAWLARVEQGRKFVNDNCNYINFSARIARHVSSEMSSL